MALSSRGDGSQVVALSVGARSAQRTGLWPSGVTVEVDIPESGDDRALRPLQLITVASAIVLQAERRGGLLLHGALAQRHGQGVLLAGPGMAGKSTASRRLPPPWRSLSDDATLVVRDPASRYWAHPWPTWSRFTFGGPGGSWDVERAVPLRALFFLTQEEQDRAEPVGAGQGTALLVEVAEQVMVIAQRDVDAVELCALRVRRFDNICDLASVVPCFELHISSTGPFWEEIERVLEDERAT